MVATIPVDRFRYSLFALSGGLSRSMFRLGMHFGLYWPTAVIARVQAQRAYFRFMSAQSCRSAYCQKCECFQVEM